MATRLGLTSFGGPVAHLGYFHDEYVRRRRWLDEEAYADLVALCQFLPGPSSSQLGIAIGALRAGPLGGLLSWLGFTLPSAVVLTALALVVRDLDLSDAGWLDGLKIVAAAVVALAVAQMARRLIPDGPRAALAAAAAAVSLALGGAAGQLVPIAAGAAIGLAFLRSPTGKGGATPAPVSRRVGVVLLALCAVLLVVLPLARSAGHAVALADSFYRTGALVFGGGHVVLPLLHGEVVPPGWVSEEAFVAGYGAAQGVPGPIFTFSAYLGGVAAPEPNGVAGAAIALGAIFLPSFLLVFGLLPFWEALRKRPRARALLAGVNAAVVGLLAAALWNPVLVTAVHDVVDALLVAGFLGALIVRVPVWALVPAGAVLGALAL